MKPNFYNGYNGYSYITRTPQSYYNNNKIIRNIGSISQTNRLRSNNPYDNNYERSSQNNYQYKYLTPSSTNNYGNNYSNNSNNQYNNNQNKYNTPSSSNYKNISNSQIYSSRPNSYYSYLSDYDKKDNNQQRNNETNYNNNNLFSSSSSDKITSSKLGLQNLGNTCYMNTSLQIISHTPIFINRLLQNKNKIDYSTPISNKFYDLINKFSTSSYAFSPLEFKSTFSSKHRQFAGYDQCDTQEFCRILLEDINSELNKIKGKKPYKELETKNKSKIQCNNEYNSLFKSREDSIVIDTFYGQIINIFNCTCNYKTYSFQNVLDLPLLIPRNETYSININKLLDLCFEGENIQFETKCEQCHQKTIHEKIILLSHPPEILILSIQRLNNRTKRKNNISVQFTEKLNLKKYIDEECCNNIRTDYELYAIANHSGTIDYGHYFAYVKIDNNWYEFNDSSVHQIGRIDTSSSNAYVLFFKRSDV